MAGIGAIAGVLSAAGTVISAAGTIAAGKRQREAAEYQAKGLEVKAKEERAAAQRQGMEIARQKRLALSTLQARSGAQGFSADDPTVLDIAGEIEKYGTLQQQYAQYGGDSRSQGLKEQATGLRISGQAAESGARSRAFGTIIGGFGSMFAKYGGQQAYGSSTNLRYG